MIVTFQYLEKREVTKMSKRFLLISVVLILVIFTGCAGGGNPVQPDTSDTGPVIKEPNSLDVTKTHLWGYYDVTIDRDTLEVEVVPNRQVEFTANVTEFLNKSVAGLTFEILEIEWEPGGEYGEFDTKCSVTHPFPGMPHYNGYDVRGVFMGNGSAVMEYNNRLVYPVKSIDQTMLDDPDDGDGGGPDGYTRWFNLTEFSLSGPPLFQYTHGKFATPGYEPSAILNPYKYFADGLGTHDDLFDWLTLNPDRNGQFSSGATNDRNYYIRFPLPDPNIVFGYAIIANWEGEDIHPSNAAEAVACDVEVTESLYYVDESTKGGDLILDISLYNWSGQPSAILVESTVLSGPYQFDPADMVPVDGGINYSTWHVEIPADNLTGAEGNEYWVAAEYSEHDYSNPLEVPNDTDDDPLTAYFRHDLYVSPESNCNDWIPVIDTLNGEISFMAVTRSYTGWQLGGDLFEDGSPGVSVSDGVTDIAVATNVDWIDQNSLTFDIDLTGVTHGTYDIVVTNGCGAKEIAVSEDMLTVLRYIEPVEANIDVVTGYGMPVDITIDPADDRVGIAYEELGQWVLWTDDYSVDVPIDTWYNPYNGRNVWIGNWDSQSHVIWYVHDSHPWYPGQYMCWSWTSFTGVQSTNSYWQPQDGNKLYDIANVQGTTQLWGIFNWFGNSVAFIGSNADGNMSYYHSFLGDPGFYNGEGDLGVVVDNIIAIDMAEYTSGWDMYILEDLPDTSTAVVELWRIGYDPILQGSFGEDFLTDVLDITVDSDYNVYVLENNADGVPQIWAWDSDHNLVGWSEPLDEDDVSGDALRIEVFLADIPDQVILLHSNGVTKTEM